MKVEILKYTENPCDSIALAAGTSYGKFDTSENRVKNIIKAGHLSCTEFAGLHFRVEGISRDCLAQLTRHRLMSFCVESQRYVRYDFNKSFTNYFVYPPEVLKNEDLVFGYEDALNRATDEYQRMLDYGIKPEDARYVLPGAMKTNLSCAMNLREFYSFLDLRLDPHAQGEIRELAQEMYNQVKELDPQGATLIKYYDEYLRERMNRI